jgi:hypothetical protein
MLVVETDAEADAEVKVGRLGLGAADELEADKVDKDHEGHGLEIPIVWLHVDLYHSCEQQNLNFHV